MTRKSKLATGTAQEAQGNREALQATEPQSSKAPLADYESTPLARSEYIAAIVHMYRGELYRANSWRMRLDTTTNWAILTTAGLLTFSFGPGSHTHWVLLLGLPLITVFHGIEARRYRFADVWRRRVRKIEENFYGPILRRDPQSPVRNWGKLVAADLLHPRLRLSRLEALRNRFTRNYWAIYCALLGAWAAQVFIHPVPAASLADVRERLTTGLLPWWVPLAWIGCFLAAVSLLVLLTPRPQSSEAEYWHDGPKDKDEEEQVDL